MNEWSYKILVSIHDIGTYETIYLTLFCISTAVLIIYAWDTRKMSKAAIQQARLIEGQYTEMAKQSGILADTLKANLRAQERELEREAAQIEEARLSRAPLIRFLVRDNNFGKLMLEMVNVRNNVRFLEWGSTIKIQFASMHPWTESKRVIVVSNTGATMYFGFKFETSAGEQGSQVFAINTGTGEYEEQPNYDFKLLPKCR